MEKLDACLLKGEDVFRNCSNHAIRSIECHLEAFFWPKDLAKRYRASAWADPSARKRPQDDTRGKRGMLLFSWRVMAKPAILGIILLQFMATFLGG